MSLESNARAVFAGHQTFHPRFGWLKKGLDAVHDDASVFARPDAPVVLGVGKNMVDAIRFWAQAFRVIAPVDGLANGKSAEMSATHFGSAMLSDNGYDPYLEDTTSLWLMHWYLCAPRSFAPIWWLFVNEFTPVEFSDSDLFDYVRTRVEASMWKTPSESSIGKDVDALLRMYTKRDAKGRQTIDDLLDSPFRNLGLISESTTKANHYRVNNAKKVSLTSTAVLFCALDYLSNADPDARTISFTRLAFEENSPGKVLRLSLDALAEYLTDGLFSDCGVKVANPGGVAQLVLSDTPETIAVQVLNKHYGKSQGETEEFVVAGPRARAALTSLALVEVL